MSILTIILCLRSSPFLKASLTIFQVRTPSTYNASGHDCYCMLDSDLHLADNQFICSRRHFYSVFCIIAYVGSYAFNCFEMQYIYLDQNGIVVQSHISETIFALRFRPDSLHLRFIELRQWFGDKPSVNISVAYIVTYIIIQMFRTDRVHMDKQRFRHTASVLFTLLWVCIASSTFAATLRIASVRRLLITVPMIGTLSTTFRTSWMISCTTCTVQLSTRLTTYKHHGTNTFTTSWRPSTSFPTSLLIPTTQQTNHRTHVDADTSTTC